MRSKRTHSRLLRLERRRTFRSLILLLLVSAALILLLLYGGVTLIIKLAAFMSGLTPTQEVEVSQDQYPVPPPSLNALPEATPSASIAVSGFSIPRSLVTLIVNGRELPTTLISDDGTFDIPAPLTDGENVIAATTTDEQGHVSPQSSRWRVIRDSSPPSLEITHPPDKQKLAGTSEKIVDIKGKTEVNATVTVNGRQTITTNDGLFSLTVELKEGENLFSAVATDKAGNQTARELTVLWQP